MRKSAVALVLLSSTALAAEPQPTRAPAPSWVKPVAIPAADPAHKSAPVQILLIDGQTRVTPKGSESYFEMAIQPQTLAGLQGTGTLAIPWNTSRADMIIHAIEIHRGGKIIDILKGNELTVLRREANLERARLDGIRTVVMPAKGLEVGDVVRFAATFVSKPDVKTKSEEIGNWNVPFDVVAVDRRLLVADGMNVRWRVSGVAPKPTVTKAPGWTEYRFTGSKMAKVEFPKFMRPRDEASDVQFSAYNSWSEVAASGRPLYQTARTMGDKSSLAVETDKIAAATADPGRRMLAALRFAQERVRYVALLLGEGAYTPVGADETWDQRFGDCKAKSALLLAMLDRLGVKAEPMYVLADKGDRLVDRLPSLQTFDHVIVRAAIDGKFYYLDATDYGQRTLADVAGSDLAFGLPLIDNGTLEALPAHAALVPSQETDIVWDASKGVVGDVPFKVTMILRGSAAITARAKQQAVAKEEEFADYLKTITPNIDNDDLHLVGFKDDDLTGDFIVTLDGKADLGWDEYQDRKGMRFAFGNNASRWDPDFDRKEGAYKDARVVMNTDYWQRDTETLMMPASAKGYRIDDAVPLDVTLAGTHIWRTVAAGADRFTAVTNFRHMKGDISADEARKADPELEKVSDNWAYVIAPKSLKLPKKPKD